MRGVYTSDGKIVYKDLTNVTRVRLTNIPIKMLKMIDDIFNTYGDMYSNNAMYLRSDEAYIDFTIPVINRDGEEFKLNRLEELDACMEKYGELQFNKELWVNKVRYTRDRRLLSNKPNSTLFINLILEYMEADYMFNKHAEKELVKNDPTKLTANFILCDDSPLMFNGPLDYLLDYFDASLDDLSDNFINEFNMLYNNTFADIRSRVNSRHGSSLRFRVIGNQIEVIEYSSPMARRYSLLLKLNEDEDEEEICETLL